VSQKYDITKYHDNIVWDHIAIC